MEQIINADIKDALENFGMKEKEIIIYLATLRLGSATANDIAQEAHINRSTTYDILRLFLEQGIAAKIKKNKATYFDVASPNKLISMLEEKKEKIKTVLKELSAIQESSISKPTVELFQGSEGFKTVLEDILETAKSTDVISTAKIFDVMVFAFPKYIIQRKTQKIFARVIQDDCAQTKELRKKDKNEYRETRTIKGFKVNSSIFIYDEKVAIIKMIKGEIISVLIHDKTIYEDQKKIFEILWGVAR